MTADHRQERPEVLATLPRPYQEQPMAGRDVHGAEQDPASIEAGQGYLQGLATLPPAARRGGNSNRSVSSSNSLTQRAGNCCKRRRMRRFFVALGVRVQDMPRALPDVAQVIQLAADSPRGEPAFAQGR